MNDDATVPGSISFGLAEMDEGHQQLLTGFAQLTALQPAEFPAAFARLVDTIEEDFRSEERLMDEIAYPGLKEHRKDHASLLAILHRVRPFIDDGNTPLADILKGMMPAMFIQHMSAMDMELADAIRNFREGRGSAPRPA